MMKINLPNRYNDNNYLLKVDENKYQLVTEYSCRIIYNDNNTIYAIDPSGGPYLAIGSKVNNKVITDFKDTNDGIILTLR